MKINVKELDEKFQALQKEMQKVGEKAVKETLNQFLDEHPEIENVHWDQYTPYFNDGDECVFRVHDIRVALRDGTEGDYSGNSHSSYSKVLSAQTKKDMQEISNLFNTETVQSGLRAAFGDHATITANRVKLEIESCEHE